MLKIVNVVQEIQQIEDVYEYQLIRQVNDLFEIRTLDSRDDFENQDKYDNFNISQIS